MLALGAAENLSTPSLHGWTTGLDWSLDQRPAVSCKSKGGPRLWASFFTREVRRSPWQLSDVLPYRFFSIGKETQPGNAMDFASLRPFT
jgi:hypothetical protein